MSNRKHEIDRHDGIPLSFVIRVFITLLYNKITVSGVVAILLLICILIICGILEGKSILPLGDRVSE